LLIEKINAFSAIYFKTIRFRRSLSHMPEKGRFQRLIHDMGEIKSPVAELRRTERENKSALKAVEV
jgi:hypothetical protein